MARLLLLFSLICACSARSATERYPFTPHAAVEPAVDCDSDDDCGHGFCRKSMCLCDYDWATQFSSEPCAYRRYSKTTALLLQIFLGGFGVGISVLDWKLAIGLYWAFVFMSCCSCGAFTVYSEDNEAVSKGICSCAVAFLSVVGLLGTYICGIAFIAGNECMDGNGFACGS